MSTHSKKGATLGLMPAVILFMVVVGMALFYFAQFCGGNKELVNATDAGALATARNILSIGLTSNEVSTLPLPTEFQFMGVDNTGAPIGITSTGDPDLSNAIFNVYAFNRAAGLTLLVSLNAAEDGSAGAIANANALISALNSFGTKLNNDLHNDPSFATAFVKLASNNHTSMLGNATVSLGNNDQVQFASVPNDGTGKANVYFNSAVYDNDPTLKSWIQRTTNNSGTMSQPNNRYNANDPNAQLGQPFVTGYQSLDISAITRVRGFTPAIYTCAVNPEQLPHMIDQGRFNNSSASSACYAPSNSTLAQASATDHRSNLLCSALGCAMLGASDNQYPISMPYGWIRIKNNPDAMAANKTQSPTLPAVPLWINGVNSIFNRELWLGAGGGAGIYLANNGVFCTESYENPVDPFAPSPPGYTGQGEMQGWINYNLSVGTGVNRDASGHDSRLNPNLAQPDGSFVLGYPSPTPNMRMGSGYNQIATVSNMLGVTSIVIYCNSDMYVAGQTPPACTAGNLAMWAGNYQNGTGGLSAGPYDFGTEPLGGLTNLEYLKGEVLEKYWEVAEVSLSGLQPTAQECTYTLNPPNLPSGSKVYERSTAVAYAVPSSQLSVAFGKIATPADLLNQLYSYNATCANVTDNTQWTDITTPLGKLLQRCKQILPTAHASDISTLLSTYTINLNEYQYIYLPIGATKLTISKTPPIFLHPYPEYTSPGSTIPDGTPGLTTCKDSPWTDSGTYTKGNNYSPVSVSNTAVNTIIGEGGDKAYGDGFTHQQPWDSFSGNLNTYDAVTWTSNSGRNNFLGELSFGNYVNGSYGTYTQPN